MNNSTLIRQNGPLLGLLFLTLGVTPVIAEGPVLPPVLPSPRPDLSRAPIVPLKVLVQPIVDTPAPSNSRLTLFRMQPGFLSDIPWLDDDGSLAAANKALEPDPEMDFFTLSYGNDNPMFDFRWRGDPGGVGFARVNSQIQMFDTSKTAMSLGLQAVTPLGLAYDGLADNRGTTVLTPGLSLFHELDAGFGLQAYVGKNMPLMNVNAQPVRRDVQVGVAINRAVTTNPADPLSNLFFSVGAMGQQRLDNDGGRDINWDVMPGMHLRLADNWWLSSGVVLPIGPNRADNGGHWRLTCRWQF